MYVVIVVITKHAAATIQRSAINLILFELFCKGLERRTYLWAIKKDPKRDRKYKEAITYGLLKVMGLVYLSFNRIKTCRHQIASHSQICHGESLLSHVNEHTEIGNGPDGTCKICKT